MKQEQENECLGYTARGTETGPSGSSGHARLKKVVRLLCFAALFITS